MFVPGVSGIEVVSDGVATLTYISALVNGEAVASRTEAVNCTINDTFVLRGLNESDHPLENHKMILIMNIESVNLVRIGWQVIFEANLKSSLPFWLEDILYFLRS